MTPQHHLPADIERTSMSIITEELAQRRLEVPPENAAVVKRVIHTTADFDYAQNLHLPRCGGSRHCRHARGRDHHHRYQHGAGGHHQAGPCQAGRAGRVLYGRPRRGGRRQRSWHHPRRSRHAQGRAGIPTRGAGRGQRPHGPAGHCRGNRKRSASALVIGVPVGFVNVVESRNGCLPHAGSTVSRPLWLWDARAAATWRRPSAMRCSIRLPKCWTPRPAAGSKKQQGRDTVMYVDWDYYKSFTTWPSTKTLPRLPACWAATSPTSPTR